MVAPAADTDTPSRAAHAVTLIPGDGIGPEVVASARRILEAVGAPLAFEEAQAGASMFLAGVPSGVPAETIDSVSRTRLVLKGPLETPVGFGEKSANVTLRKLFETYANVRPVRELPGVPTPYSGRNIDLVVVRENVEDLYAGIEHMQTPDVAQCLKLITRPGCERIVRFAFELARAEGRGKVACATKSNIMKLTEGLLKAVFEEIAPEYPEIEASHVIVDNCAHQLVKRPEQFGVIVTTNLNGDILSDLASGLVGGLGFAPSGNIGRDVAIFEAVHGSAPKYAGKDVINPTAMILSAVMLLRHIGEFGRAARVEGAIMLALAEGHTTRDVSGDANALSTTAFTDVVIGNLDRAAADAPAAREHAPVRADFPRMARPAVSRTEAGADVFVEWDGDVMALGPLMEAAAAGTPFTLKMISNRGTKVYPPTGAMTDCVNQYRCRFIGRNGGQPTADDLLALLARVGGSCRWMHVERLQAYDGEPAYTRAQGED
ncbi:MAG: NADP-dependent isocitrate dehydrogenase [Chloroflexota bacterium]